MKKPKLTLIQGGLSDKPEDIPDASGDFSLADLVKSDMFDFKTILPCLDGGAAGQADPDKPAVKITRDRFGEETFDFS